MAITPSQWSHVLTIPESYTPSAATTGQTLVITESVIAKLSSADQATFWSNVQNGGGDVRICESSDGTNQLPVEVVNLDSSAETCVIWTRKASYDGTGSLYLFIGKTGETQPPVTDPFGRNAVWQDSVRQWNMNESPASLIDSTGKSGGYTDYDVSGISLSSGLNGGALDFAQFGGYINVDSIPELSSAPFSLSTIIRMTDVTSTFAQTVFSSRGPSGEVNTQIIIFPPDGGSDFILGSRGRGNSVVDNNPVQLNEWVHVTLVNDTSSNRLYVNGVLVSTSNFPPLNIDQTGVLNQIGAMQAGDTPQTRNANRFDYGKIDSIGIYNGAKTLEYIATEYANQSDPATFYGTPTLSNTATSYSIALDAGSYIYTGQGLQLSSSRVLQVDAGSYSLNGSGLSLKASRFISVEQGDYTYTGSDVTLRYNQAGGPTYSIQIDSGTYALSGSEASLAARRKINSLAALRLNDVTQSVTIDVEPPYEGKVTYKDGSLLLFAASLENGTPTITPERATWLRDANGNLLFDSNKQLLEVAP